MEKRKPNQPHYQKEEPNKHKKCQNIQETDHYLVIAKFALTYSAAKLDKENIKTPNEVKAYRTDLAQTLNMYNEY